MKPRQRREREALSQRKGTDCFLGYFPLTGETCWDCVCGCCWFQWKLVWIYLTVHVVCLFIPRACFSDENIRSVSSRFFNLLKKYVACIQLNPHSWVNVYIFPFHLFIIMFLNSQSKRRGGIVPLVKEAFFFLPVSSPLTDYIKYAPVVRLLCSRNYGL